MMDSDEENWRGLGGEHPLEYALMVDLVDEYLDMMEDDFPEYVAPSNIIFSDQRQGSAMDLLPGGQDLDPCPRHRKGPIGTDGKR